MQKIGESKKTRKKPELIAKLQKTALAIKQAIVQLGVHAGEGHCASGLSMTDLLTVLYFHTMRIDPNNPDDPGRDRFVLSKGHGSIGLYCALHQRGYFDHDKLYSFLQPGSGLGGHPLREGAPGVELSTGSLGHGMSMAVGMAMAAQMDRKEHRVFVLIGDGESNEGIVWEAAALAAHRKLDNLICVLDRNNYQCDGFSKDILDMNPLAEKWRAFGWEVIECQGHDIQSILKGLAKLPFAPGKPSLLLAHTVKGKGVSFMESSADWHYRAPKKDELEKAMAEIDKNCGVCN